MVRLALAAKRTGRSLLYKQNQSSQHGSVYSDFSDLFAKVRKMGKVKKQLAVSNAQPAPQKNGGVTKTKKTVLNKGLVNPRSINPVQRAIIPVIQRPIQTVQQRLLAAIQVVPYFPLAGPAKIQNLKTAYIQLHVLNLSLLGMHQFVCAKGKGKGNATDKRY
jgi:hypothetical protein